MAKSKSVYVCSECGYESARWYGKCPSCGQWNTLEEKLRETVPSASSMRASRGAAQGVVLTQSEYSQRFTFTSRR